MISHEYKCIFIHPPRNGGKSIEKALFGVAPVPGSADHTSIRQWQRKLNKELFDSYFKFVFVRNPWDRLASVYHHRLSFLSSHPKYKKVRGYLNLNSFDEFIKACHPKKGPLRSQSCYILKHGGNIGVDFIGRLENYEEDWQKVCEKLNVGNILLPHLNKSLHKKYWKYYNEDLIKIVGEKFEIDIKLFNYKFR